MADNTTPNTTISSLLPDVYQSDISRTITAATFDQLLTQDDVSRIVGSIGKGVPASEYIKEATPGRQNNQLQPIVATDSGDTNFVLPQSAFLKQLSLMGVDTNKANVWASAKVANWAPPINFDKLANFQDYYWVGTDQPQYIVVENPCAILQSKYDQLQAEVTRVGSASNAGVVLTNVITIPGRVVSLYAPTASITLTGSLGTSSSVVQTAIYTGTVTNITVTTAIPALNGESVSVDMTPTLTALQAEIAACVVPPSQQWMINNKWAHRSQIPQNQYIVRAQIPILEYRSDIEQHEWNMNVLTWYYRPTSTSIWAISDIAPTRLNLQPVIDYELDNDGVHWILRLVGASSSNIDLTRSFPDGTTFQVRDDTHGTHTYHILRSEYRQYGSDWCTYVYLADPLFYNNPVAVNGNDHASVFPSATSVGQGWEGYDIHWKVDLSATQAIPVATPAITPTSTTGSDLSDLNLIGSRALDVNEVPIIIPTALYAHDVQVHTTNADVLFNMYDIGTGSLVSTSPLFHYTTNPDSPINPSLGRRLLTTADGRDYEFTTDLVSSSGQLYAYRIDPISTGTYWYSTISGVVQQWDGGSWTTSIYYNESGHLVRRLLTTADTLPTTALLGTKCYVPATNIMYQYGTVGWVALSVSVLVEDADPSFRTVWASHDMADYVPTYETANGTAVIPGDPTGDWATFEQWSHNVTHETRKAVRYTEIYPHLRSILANQPYTPGDAENGAHHILSISDYDMKAGGLIRDYADGMDTLISAVNVSNASPLSVLDFAEQQYSVVLASIEDYYVKTFTGLDGVAYNTTPSVLKSFNSSETAAIIAAHANNSFYAKLFGDSTASSAVANWPATPAIFGILPATVPTLSYQDGMAYMVHHDGHRSIFSINDQTKSRLSRIIISTTDIRTGSKYGVTAIVPPTTETSFITSFGIMRTQVYVYSISTNTLRRFSAIAAQGGDPNPATTLEGNRYYNTATHTPYQLQSGVWVATSAIGSGDVSDMWEVIDFTTMYADAVFEIENRLYAACPGQSKEALALLSSVDMETNEAADRFNRYCTVHNIVSPFRSAFASNDAFTWNYSRSTSIEPPYTITTQPIVGCWQALYQAWYGTPYPQLEPWKLQGYLDEPTWWNQQYADTTGGRRWIYNHATTTGMWANIMNGVVPSGFKLPNGVISTGSPALQTYVYVSVNIADTTILGGYQPDEVLPPYYSIDLITDPSCRSLYAYLSSELPGTQVDYVFGIQGTTEWEWTVSTEYVYDQLAVSFIQNPMRMMDVLFGYPAIAVGGLRFNQRTEKPHVATTDLPHTAEVPYAGMWQWYTQLNRYTGFDQSTAFTALWNQWSMRLGYLTGGIVDENAFDASHKYYEITPRDYQLILTNTGVIQDGWVDSFNVSLTYIPPSYLHYNTQARWEFEVQVPAAFGRSIQAYSVRQYPCVFDATTNLITTNAATIQHMSTGRNQITVTGDVRNSVYGGDIVQLVNTVGADGSFTAATVAYNAGDDETQIVFNEALPVGASIVTASQIWFTADSSMLTGDLVDITATSQLPSPATDQSLFYAIRISARTIQLAVTYNEALASLPITIGNVREGAAFIGLVSSTFVAMGGITGIKDVWKHYQLDRSLVRTITPPMVLRGMQNLINLVDGYSADRMDHNIVFNRGTSPIIDPETGRTVDWQYEIEQFIVWADRLRSSKLVISDRYETSVVSTVDDTIQFTSTIPMWTTGTKVRFTTTGTLPAPLQNGRTYYYVAVDVGVFKLSSSSITDDISHHIDLTTPGVGRMHAFLGTLTATSYPTREINPMRAGVWINTPLGLLSDVMAGPYQDIRIQQTVFDQNGKALAIDNVMVFRDQKITQIATRQKGDLHLAGARLLIEGYEHVLAFNDYTTAGALVFDPFLGLSATQIHVDYYEKKTFDMRPDVGGYYRVGNTYLRNLEASVTDLRNAYDIFAGRQSIEIFNRAANIIGFRPQPYLDPFNVGRVSQLMFYRGMIQSKGSTASINAYINSKRFKDAQLDEVWAWKIATYGDSREARVAQLKINSTDLAVDDIRFKFADTLTPLETTQDFKAISFNTSPDRWIPTESQRELLGSDLYLLNSTVSFTTRLTALPLVIIGLEMRYQLPQAVDAVRVIDPNLPIGFSEITARLINSTTIGVPIGTSTACVLYGLTPAYESLSPSYVYDTATDINVATVPAWDPARGQYQASALANISVLQLVDPARYNTSQIIADRVDTAWNHNELNMRWADTTLSTYVPYWDRAVFPDDSAQIFAWGQLAPWASVPVYEWIKATVAPEDWQTYVQANPSTASGVARSVTRKRSRPVVAGPVTVVNGSAVITGLPTISLDDTIIFPGVVPAASITLEVGTPYNVVFVNGIDASGGYGISTDYAGSAITFATTSSIICKLGYRVSDWITDVPHIVPVSPSFLGFGAVASPLMLILSAYGYAPTDAVIVYINQVEAARSTGADTPVISVSERDQVTIVRLVTPLTDEETNFNPDIQDDGNTDTQRKVDYPHTALPSTDRPGAVDYFFWVENYAQASTVYASTCRDAGAALLTPPVPYMIVLDATTVTYSNTYGRQRYAYGADYPQLADQTYLTKTAYTKVCLRNITHLITDNDRYTWMLVQDETSRDSSHQTASVVSTSVLKARHQEWQLFWRSQSNSVDRWLWDRLTEAMAGRTLDSTQLVPHVDRVLYDGLHGTDDQFGLGSGQAFGRASDLIGTILAYVSDPLLTIPGVDLDSFRVTYLFDTADSIIAAMNLIYNSFPVEHVNNMWFNTLDDALSVKQNYEGMMKTSWVVIHGVQLINEQGLLG